MYMWRDGSADVWVGTPAATRLTQAIVIALEESYQMPSLLYPALPNVGVAVYDSAAFRPQIDTTFTTPLRLSLASSNQT